MSTTNLREMRKSTLKILNSVMVTMNSLVTPLCLTTAKQRGRAVGAGEVRPREKTWIITYIRRGTAMMKRAVTVTQVMIKK